ncbi:MAG: GNAT family N-acetyltransferase [Kaistella sp.]|nr:GNAT family N-acetyltransferase [Kaistella sp.]
MLDFEVIENDPESWDAIVKSSLQYDFHHTAYFHKIDNPHSSRLLYFGSGKSFIALPVVIRPIEGSSFFDITSVYGYAGPIYRFENDAKKEELISFFRKIFQDFCASHHIVSVFSRLHPLISQLEILEGLGEIADLNQTVTIDLTIQPELQRSAYRKSLKSELNQLRRKDYLVTKATSREETDAFITIYYETMDRVQAAPEYYFSREYFYEFLNNPSFEASLLIAKDGDLVIAGAVFTHTESIMQYHLAGTAGDYSRDTPMKLILDEARLLGNSSKAESLHLGGGVGGSSEDSLFKFKSAFSKDFKQFSVWRYVVNEDVYAVLSEGKAKTNFFPLYRS